MSLQLLQKLVLGQHAVKLLVEQTVDVIVVKFDGLLSHVQWAALPAARLLGGTYPQRRGIARRTSHLCPDLQRSPNYYAYSSCGRDSYCRQTPETETTGPSRRETVVKVSRQPLRCQQYRDQLPVGRRTI